MRNRDWCLVAPSIMSDTISLTFELYSLQDRERHGEVISIDVRVGGGISMLCQNIVTKPCFRLRRGNSV